MRREDFKEIREEHFKGCETLIKQEGRCMGVSCINDCPFSRINSINGNSCIVNKYSKDTHLCYFSDSTLVVSAKEFLKFKEEDKMEKEKVLEVEFQDVFDKVAVRIAYQNEEVLKRNQFKDEEIRVTSVCYPDFDSRILYILGYDKDEDNRCELVSKEKAEEIKKKVEAINEKYGIPKRWRSEKGEKYFFIASHGEVMCDTDSYLKTDDERYELGNYFKTEKEAQAKLDKIKPIFKED